MTNKMRISDGVYRAVWRWHSYAGLVVLPFLAMLAVTGALYLYKPEIESVVYARWSHVQPHGAPLPLATISGRAERATGAKVSQIASSAAPEESWRLTLTTASGDKRTAFVDPYSGRVLGITGQGGLMGTVKNIHSLMIAGPIGNALIEIVAGWAIVLVLTGLYLWWPRGASPAIGVRGRPSRRLFWRDLHASTGLIAGAVVLFLAVTGMPWSGVAGEALQAYVAGHGLGRPRPPTGPVVEHHADDATHALPWSLQRSAPPPSAIGRDVGPDRAVAVAGEHGIAAPWTLTFPREPDAPYVVSAAIVKAEDAHVVYIDAATGAVLQDASYAAFGPAARTIEWGIAAHQGLEYGELNRLLMLFGCVAVLMLAVSAVTMWWKRRAAGTTSAASGRTSERGVGVLLSIMLVTGILLPLTGLTMFVALAIDLGIQGRVPAGAGPA